MKFSTYFILISYLMIGVGLAAVALSEAINPVIIAGISIIALINLYLQLKGRPIIIAGFLWNAITIVIIAAAAIDYLMVTGSLIEVSIRFLTILMVAKLFDLRTNRDYAILYILTFFQLLSASASTVNISFLLVLALYILTGIWAMILFNLKREWEERSPIHKEMPKNILSPYFFIITAGLAALSLIITISLFFIIPRMGIGFLPKKTAETLKVSGFAEKVDFGEIGPIKLDPTIIMRVELHPPSLKGGLYFRGMTFDYYNGAQWQQTIKEMTPLQKDNRGIWNLKPGTTGAQKSEILTQNILLEPIETNVLFAASDGIGIAGNFRSLMADSAGSFYVPAPSYARIRYTAYSVPSPVRKEVSDIPPQYLKAPPDAKKIFSLAQEISADKKTPLDKAFAIEEYLKKNYRYALNPGKGRGENPLDDFLFYTKKGYCEQYATAMAVMLRAINIPSRLVTGFLPGEWNRFGGYLIIRARDAHTWVEAYIPGSGWTTFDPTPSAEASGALPQPTSSINLYIDSLRWRWSRYIINYSFQDQISLARVVEEKGRMLISQLKWQSVKKEMTFSKKNIFIITTAIIIICVILTAFRIASVRHKKRATWDRTPAFYREMLKILARKGMVKKIDETPLEFAKKVNLKEVKAVTDIYYQIRFGGHSMTDGEKVEISAGLKTVRDMHPRLLFKI